MTTATCSVDHLLKDALRRFTQDLDWGIEAAWNPALHPRDKRGRFTKSRTVKLTTAETARGRAVIAAFKPKAFTTDADAVAYLKKGPDLPEEQAGAVDSYTGDAFLDINRKLRSGAGAEDDETVQQLRAAMRPTPDDLILTRTVNLDAFGTVRIEDLAGMKVKDAGFSSSSLGLAYGGDLGNVRMRIAVPKGTPAVFAPRYSRNPDEREIILPDGMEFAVASVTKNDRFGYDMTLIVLPKEGVENRSGTVTPHQHDHHRIVDVGTEDIPEPPPGVPAEDVEAVEAVDLAQVQAAFEAALAALLAVWAADVVAGWIDQLVDAVRAAIAAGDLVALAALTVDTDDAAVQLLDAMVDLAEVSAGHVVDEAAEQDITTNPVVPDREDLEPRATTTAKLEGGRYAAAAGREASRMADGGLDADEVADYVRTHLEEMSDAGARGSLGGALTGAQNTSRFATFAAAPEGALYASEVNDRNTCIRCREIHGRWIANTSDMEIVYKLYPGSGYVNCLGGYRCRGTIVGVWRPQQTKEGAA